ncbi:glycosyl hydrolase family 28-related protein [Klebsiella aerogenes]|uniref:glycosyl hydrolase family 28-related protein n=1 Tax=Klebsiella aerogenes TaxID=548 RepID=UPI0021B47AF4|nr:glycosyl hydrolase family 28-related protein [Klebsiella aerogenes]
MTVSTEVDHNDYTGNGVTTSFPYTFRIFQKSDLMVQVADLNENITVLTLDTDYTVTGAGGYSGGAVVLTSPLANGWQISISRDLPLTQETDLRNQGKFFAEVHEDAFDKLTMLIQQCFGFLRLALRKPSFIANYYDALNNRIRNLRDPSQAQDAATKKYVDDGNAGSNSYADALFRKTLRVPEVSVPEYFILETRSNMLVGCNDRGEFVPIAGQTETADLAIKLAALTGASLIGGLSFISPEMYGAKGDGIADDTAAIQAAIEAAKTRGTYRVSGMGKYRIFSPIKLDNLGQGFRLDLQDVIADPSFPATSDWKTANGMFEYGGESNGSMVGVETRIGFASGNNVATLFKLKGYGAGGSYFFSGRVQDCVGVFDCTNSTQANSNSNLVEGLYWLRGTYGIRLRRNGSFVVEGTKIRVGFMTGLKYGGIQLFNGAQYFSINSTGIDFCGRNLTQLTVNALPPTSVRETMLTNNNTGATFEVLDVYEQFKGSYSILVIEPSSSEGGSTNFSAGQTVTVGGVSYTISAVTTSVTGQAYFDFIHGFQGAPFSRCYAQFDYLSRAVGGNFNGTTLYFYNSFQEVTNSVNNIWLRQQGKSVKMVDRWTGKNLLDFDTGGNGTLTIPGGLSTNGTVSLGGSMYVGSQRVFGSEVNTTLTQNVAKTVMTLAWKGDGTVTTTKEMYRLTVAGPNGITGVGGQCMIAVDPNGAVVIGANGVGGMTITTSGFSVQATETTQASMNVTFTFERK